MMVAPKLRRLAALLGLLGLTSPALAECDFSTHLFRNALSNPAEIQHIAVEIKKGRKWFKNSISILASFDGDVKNIGDQFKDKLAAKINVRYSFGECQYKAQVRQSGDWDDHIELLPGGNVVSSLDVKLREGNILNAVRFKLLLPHSRNGINEVLGALLLRELGYIAPETFMVSGDINNVKHQFLFQENTKKELLERNLRREGPIFEGDEGVLWNVDGFKPFALENISLARLTNGKWAEKGETSTKMALKAFQKLQAAYIAYSNRVGKKGYFGLRVVPNLQESDHTFETYGVLLTAMKGGHSLRPHNRKFYFNSFSQSFEPIYYDGNMNLRDSLADNFHPEAKEDVEFFLSHASPDELARLAERIEALSKNVDFKAGFLKRVGDKRETAPEFFRKSLEAISINLDRLRKQQAAFIPAKESKLSPDFGELQEQLIKRTQEKGPQTSFMEVDGQSEKQFFAHRVSGKDNGVEFTISPIELINVMTDNTYGNERLILLPKMAQKEEQQFSVTPFLGGQILASPGAGVESDSETRELTITQTEPTDWVMIRNAEIDGWTVSFEGAAQNKALVSAQRFNEFGLTGCVNFYNVDFTATRILGRNGQCEDSINIVSSRGMLKELVVESGFADAIDIDFSKIAIEILRVENTGNDCFDVSTGEFDITTAELSGCADKGISVGENSVLTAADVNITGAVIGVSSKDFSDVKITNFVGDQMETCLEAFQKKQEFGGGQLVVESFSCTGKILKDQASGIILNGLRQ